MINQHFYYMIFVVIVVSLSVIACEKKKATSKNGDDGDKFNSMSFKNNSKRSIWVERIEGIEGGARCGILGEGAQSTIGGLQLDDINGEVKIEWWYGKSRIRPDTEEDVFVSKIKVSSKMKGGDNLWFVFNANGKWSYEVNNRAVF